MDVQILSTDQQKYTLSGKKQAKRKISARNTLSTPYSPYWPVVSPECEAELESTLNDLLPLARRTRQLVSWSELRKMTKQQRLEARSCSDKAANNLSGSVVLGVNGVSRALEVGALSCVLVAGDAKPRVLVSHLATLSAVHGLPLLVLSSLRHIGRATLGVACLALGIKKCVADCKEHKLRPLLEQVTRLWTDVPQPECEAGYFSSPAPDLGPEDGSPSELEYDDGGARAEDLYLHRTSRKERVFVPGDGQPLHEHTQLPEFISLQVGGKEVPALPSSTHQQCRTGTKFYPLKVKRIKPNPKKINKRRKGKITVRKIDT